MPKLETALEKVQDVFDFKDLRETMRREVKKADDDADEFFGKREPFAFFETDASMEPERNKVVKVSSVIVAVNLMIATFMVRTWPKVLKEKLAEFAGTRLAGKTAAETVGKLALPELAKGLTGAIKAVVGALSKSKVQESEMKKLEKAIREPCKKIRASFNKTALSQAVKPSRMGSTSTRREVLEQVKPPRSNARKKKDTRKSHKKGGRRRG